MLKIEKLSEKNLKSVIEVLFPEYSTHIESQKRFKGSTQTFIVDYFIDTPTNKIAFEFDGPTHFNNTKTQIRDMNFVDYCRINNITLVRIPYFIQIDSYTLHTIFPAKIIDRFGISDKINDISCRYHSGFHDAKIVYPSDFNSHGVDIMMAYCESDEVGAQLYNSLSVINDLRLVLGINWDLDSRKRNFISRFSSFIHLLPTYTG